MLLPFVSALAPVPLVVALPIEGGLALLASLALGLLVGLREIKKTIKSKAYTAPESRKLSLTLTEMKAIFNCKNIYIVI